MNFELSFELGELDAAAAEAACFDAGAFAVTFTSASVECEPILEPKPDEVRLWRATCVRALYPAESVGPAMIVALASSLGLEAAQLSAQAIADRAWEREWLRDFHAMRFGERLWICPRHESVEASEAVIVWLDPGLAFGSGTHASTALCLEWLDRAARGGAPVALDECSVIDYGCGSGVLAIAALKLGARRAYAFDTDPQALRATAENAAANAVAERLCVCERREHIAHGSEVLLANILGTTLISHAEEFAALLRSAGALLLSGILAEEETEVAVAFVKWFDMKRCAQRDGWVALSGTRR